MDRRRGARGPLVGVKPGSTDSRGAWTPQNVLALTVDRWIQVKGRFTTADHLGVSIDAAVARIAQIETMLAPTPPKQSTSTATSTGGAFADVLSNESQASSTAALPTATSTVANPVTTSTTRSLLLPAAAVATTPAQTGGAAIVAAAASQVGVTEQPPGSNDSAEIAAYRGAVSGAGIGPWCAQFVSWAAKQAGEPVGEQGQGFQSVSALYDWAQRTGRAVAAGPGVVPAAGDLIVWGSEHIGIVDSVDADGSIHTIEGNSGNAVTRHAYGSDGNGATGFVRLS